MGREQRIMVSSMVEDYLTLIWKAYEWPGTSATTGELAARLSVRASTVSGNLTRLAEAGYIDYEPYGTITLTEAGNEIAVRTIRRHRILESYLVHDLGLSWLEVHDMADRLEHAASDLLIERMDRAMGFPATDPHGDVIPRDAGMRNVDSLLLTEAVAGQSVSLVRVSDRWLEALEYLSANHVTLGDRFRVIDVQEAAGVVSLARDEGQLDVPWRVALEIRVAD